MTEAIVTYFQSVTRNDYLTLFLVSIIPIIELRGALILSAGMNVNPYLATIVSILGSSIVILPIIFLLKPVINKLKKTKLFKKLALAIEDVLNDKADKVIKSGEKVKTKNLDLKKFYGLLIFVGVPLPFTGAWTGSAIGASLNMKFYKSAFAIFLGNIVAALILSVLIRIIPVKYIDIILYAFLTLVLFSLLFAFFMLLSKHKKKSKSDNATINANKKLEE